MEDHPSVADTLVEERDELMVPPKGGNPTFRKAHFLKPIFTQDHLLLPPSPTALLASKPTFERLKKGSLQSLKGPPSEKWKLWVQSLKPRYQETWKKAGIYDAILASTYTIPKDKDLIIGLAEKWCVDTNTFVFPWGEVTITLEDVIHLGCFSVLGASFMTPLDDESFRVFDCLNNDRHIVRSIHCRNATPLMWMKYFISSGRQLEHEAFLAYWLSKFVFVRAQIAAQDCHVAIHLSRGNRIALAPVVLACIYRDMRLLHKSIVECMGLECRVVLKLFTSHYDLVQMWVWERFMELRPIPKVIERGEPRLARWNGVTKLKFIDVRAALDSAGLSFLWRPYARVSSNSMLSDLYKDNEQWVAVESDALESFAQCLKASELVGLSYTEQYLPHRVSMQFGLDQDIPSHVVRSNENPNTSWSGYNMPIGSVKLYIPPRLFESDVSSRYVVWWRGLVSVNQEMVTNSIQIEKHLPLVFSGHERNVKSLATSGCVSGFVEKKPEDGFTNAQLTIESKKADSSGKRNDCDDVEVSKNYVNVEEDSLAIAQVLNRSRKRDSFEKARDVDNEMVLNTGSQKLLAICHQEPEKLNCTSEPTEVCGQIFSSSEKCEKSISSNKKETEPEEDKIVTGNLKSTNQPAETSVQRMSFSVKLKNSETSAERQIKTQEAVETLGNNVINIEDESCEEKASELQHLGLEDRIWRLEMIIDMIKEEKSAATSRVNLEQ